MTTADEFCLFALDPDRRFATNVAERLGLSLAPLEDRVFEDGEYKIRPLESVRGHDVYVLSSLYHGEGASSAGQISFPKWLLLQAVEELLSEGTAPRQLGTFANFGSVTSPV